MPWTTLHLQVTTPIFNSGAEGDAGLRVPSLRGAMRFWFRALAGMAVGNDLSRLAALERHVFGATSHASPVKLRLATQPIVAPLGQPAWCRGEDGRWITYLLGQGLWDMRKREVSKRYVDA